MQSPDVLIVGAGIFGLSVAWSCRQAGLSVRVLEAGRVGRGASGGVVGALAPHAPTRWRPMKAFQFDALLGLSSRIEKLEAESGLSAGYARTGRLSPLPDEAARLRAETEAAAAPAVWGKAARFEVIDTVPAEAEGWIAPDAATHGLIRDTLTARVDPRAYLGTLATVLADTVEEETKVIEVSPTEPAVTTTRGTLSAGAIVLTAGAGTWLLAGAIVPDLAGGRAVKGQAAVLGAAADGLPVIWQRGLYIIPHGRGRVAVGSTSEKEFTYIRPDALLDDVVARARAVAPRLREAPVMERWAGVRPKPPGREPVVGEIAPGVWVASGGFKIGFGIAHAIGDAVAAGITGGTAPIPLPDTFAPSADK